MKEILDNYGNKYILKKDNNLYLNKANNEFTDMIIPSEINGHKVTGIADSAFILNKKIEYIELPDTLVEIGSFSFRECKNLKKINLPKGLQELTHASFSNCESLEEIVIPNTVTKIPPFTFIDCKSLEKIALPNSIIEIDKSAFSDCNSLTKISIPGSVKKMHHTIFGDKNDYGAGCANLKTIKIGIGAGKLSANILDVCPNLEEVFVDRYDMLSQSNLNEIVIKTILNNLDYYDGKELAKGLKKKKKVCSELLFSANTKIIEFLCDNNLFQYEEVLKRLEDNNLTDELRFILLNYCNTTSNEIKQEYEAKIERKEKIDIGLEDVTLEYMKNEWRCSKKDNKIIFTKYIGTDSTVIIPSSIDGISSYVFKKQSKNLVVEKIIFQHGIKELYFDRENRYGTIFGDYYALKDIYIPNSLEILDVESHYILRGQGSGIAIHATDENGKELDMLIVNKTLVCVTKNVENLIIPDGVTKIGNQASMYRKIINLEIPQCVESIGYRAFLHCGLLKSIKMSNGLKSIGEDAFYRCDSLVSIEIPDSVTHIGDRTFGECRSLKEVSLSSNLVTIEEKAFFLCSQLKEIFIPSSVENIGSCAFYNYPQIVYTPLKKRPEGWSGVAFGPHEKIHWGKNK